METQILPATPFRKDLSLSGQRSKWNSEVREKRGGEFEGRA
jgi:hypothetical protein